MDPADQPCPGHDQGIGRPLASLLADSFPHKVRGAVPEALQSELQAVLDMIASPMEQNRGFDRQSEDLCKDRYLKIRILWQIAGVGSVTALTFILAQEDPGRFHTSRQVGLALELFPRVINLETRIRNSESSKLSPHVLNGPTEVTIGVHRS